MRAPADGWITNLNVHAGEYITRGSVAVALVKKDSFYILGVPEETKLNGLNRATARRSPRSRSNRIMHGTVDSAWRRR